MGGLIFDIHAEVLEEKIDQFLGSNDLAKVFGIYTGKDFADNSFKLENISVN